MTADAGIGIATQPCTWSTDEHERDVVTRPEFVALRHVAPIWLGIGALVAVGVGIMMSDRSGKPTVTEEVDR